MNTTASSIALHTIIAEQSALPGGFAIDTVIETYSNNAHKICNRLASNGKLYKAKASHFLIRYFSTECAAKAFLAEHGAYQLLKPAPRQISFKKQPKSTHQKPTQTAEIIYPAGYKHSYHPMPAPRNQVLSLPFVHGGMRAMA